MVTALLMLLPPLALRHRRQSLSEPALQTVNSAIRDGDGQCFLLMICKKYDLVYLAASPALSIIGD